MGESHYQLFSTSACHLCELAQALLDEAGVCYKTVDISDSDDLFNQYGVRIPVLRSPDGRELGWPFDWQQLGEFLAA